MAADVMFTQLPARKSWLWQRIQDDALDDA